jgi:hypothetical protein
MPSPLLLHNEHVESAEKTVLQDAVVNRSFRVALHEEVGPGS